MKLKSVVKYYRNVESLTISIREYNMFKFMCNYDNIPIEYQNREVRDFFFSDWEQMTRGRYLVIDVKGEKAGEIE